MSGVSRRMGGLALLWPAMAAAEPALHDPGGDRIEMFQWANQGRPESEPLRHCSRDGIWCAELHFPHVGQRGLWELRVVRRANDRDPEERHWRYVMPENLAEGDGFESGISIWTEIVRDWWGGALIGLDLSRATGTRPGFFSNQRRLRLLHIPSAAGAEPYVVLEIPLSGYIEQPMCPYPGYPPDPAAAVPPPEWRPGNGEIRLQGVLSDEEVERRNACHDRFEYGTLFALMPSSQPADQPPDLIVATVAATSPGRRPRTPLGTHREPIVRTEGDVVRDPVCTFTRSYYFDAAQRRYVPDAPLPACGDYLEP